MPGASNFLSVLGHLGKNPKQEAVLNDVGVTRIRKPNGFALQCRLIPNRDEIGVR